VSDLSAHIGERIRLFRKNRRLTQEQLGELVELPQSYVGGIERGEKNISLETLERIIVALDIKPGELFRSTYVSDTTEVVLEKDKWLDSILLSLQSRTVKEMKIIDKLIKDVLEALDSK
jgi:transcriptional regulator with XRE-family HTH domain